MRIRLLFRWIIIIERRALAECACCMGPIMKKKNLYVYVAKSGYASSGRFVCEECHGKACVKDFEWEYQGQL